MDTVLAILGVGVVVEVEAKLSSSTKQQPPQSPNYMFTSGTALAITFGMVQIIKFHNNFFNLS
jgi:hypothetical protein